MSLVINTNVGALNAQRQLVSSGSELSQAMERLSSGRRINSAADDAAGLAISNRQTSQIRGLDQAIRNANDGVSLIQTAEGALDESTNILQRMRELSIQSANGIYSDADRATLDAEFQQLIEELDRIAETTSFNGQNLLDGTLGDVALHIGSEADQIIDFSIQGMSTSDLGLGATSSDLNGGRINIGNGDASSIGEGDVLINNQALSAITDLGGADPEDTTLFDVIDDINTNIEGVSASGYNVVVAEGAGSGIISDTETLRLTLGSVDDQAAVTYDISNTESMDDLVETINQITGGNITAALDDSGKLSLSNVTGGTIGVSFSDESPFATAGPLASAVGDTAIESITGISVGADLDGTESFNGSIALTADDGSTITITKGAGGTSADLSVLGFPEVVGAGEVLGVSLDSDGQNDPLASGDLIINGTNIGAIPEDEGLQAKLDAINAQSDETGVTATSLARDAFTTKTMDDYTELTSDSTAFTAGTLTINGVDVTISDVTAAQTALDINGATTNTGVSAFVDGAGELHLFSEGQITLGGAAVASFGTFTQLDGTTQAGAGTYVASVPSSVSTSLGSVSINGTEVSLSDISSVDTIVEDINIASGSTGVRAVIDDNGELQLSSPSRINIQLGASDNALTSLSALGVTLDNSDGDNNLSNDTYIIDPAIKLDSANDASISVEATTDGTAATGLQSLNTDLSATLVGSALATLSIGTAEGANAAIGSIDQALETINATRSDLGAINNRLEFTMSNLSNISENTSAARSRIVDADFAAESANLSRAQVLQQASQAMLAQANAQPQQVLQLLQG